MSSKRRNRAARRLCGLCAVALLGCRAGIAQTGDVQVRGHTKYRATAATFPDESLFRSLAGPSAEDLGFDARLNLEWGAGGWDLRADAELGVFYGDSIEFRRDLDDGLSVFAPRLPGDDRRLLDLTHTMTDTGKRAAVIRLDRLSAGYTTQRGVLRFGRQAVTWGNGLIFNTVLDIFNPFDPAAIDTEYKSGDDMLYGQLLRDNGHDLEGVIVVRRDPLTSNREADQSSFAAKYHGFLNAGEYDLVLARHFGESLVGVGGNLSLGGALWRGDLTVTSTDDGTVVSAVTSLSQSFTWAGRNVSAIVEYYVNGFGQRDGRYGPAELAANPALGRRLARGELFNLGRQYLGLSSSIELTPLILLTPSVFLNLEDESALLQVATRIDLAQSMLLLGALNVPVGGGGTEYGGIDSGMPGVELSSGPGLFVQLAWYF